MNPKYSLKKISNACCYLVEVLWIILWFLAWKTHTSEKQGFLQNYAINWKNDSETDHSKSGTIGMEKLLDTEALINTQLLEPTMMLEKYFAYHPDKIQH